MNGNDTPNDIGSYKAKISNKSSAIQALKQKSDLFNSALSQIESYRYPLKVVFFGKSVAFRVGASSVKDINLPGVSGLSLGFKTTFKTGFVEDFTQILNSGTSSLNKHSLVVLAAGYYILFKESMVTNETDKSIKAEASQIISATYELNQLKLNNDYINLRLGKELYKIDEIKKVPGVPKADAAFYYKNKPIVYLSLKQGQSAGNFLQYGGWANDLGIKTRQDVRGKPVFEDFVSRVELIFQNLGLTIDSFGRYDFNELKKGSYFGLPLENDYVSSKVKFGKDYSPASPFGINNVQVLLDGSLQFSLQNGVYNVSGKYHTELNPNLKENTSYTPDTLYKPIMILYKSEGQGLNQGGFSNARASVWPNNRVAQAAISKFELAEQLIKNKQIDQLKKTFLK
jgi:hypothetical protein